MADQPDINATLTHDFMLAAAALVTAQLSGLSGPGQQQVADTMEAGDVHLELRLNVETSVVELLAVPNSPGDPVWLARASLN